MATKEELKDKFVPKYKVKAQDMHDVLDVSGEPGTQGEQGPPGSDGSNGEQGPKGEPGEDGADGFGTEEQYNDIISRLEALETDTSE